MKKNLFILIFIFVYSITCVILFSRDMLSGITKTKVNKNISSNELQGYQESSDSNFLVSIPVGTFNNGNEFLITINVINNLNDNENISVKFLNKDNDEIIYSKNFNVKAGKNDLFSKIYYENKYANYILKIESKDKDILGDIKIIQSGIVSKRINAFCYLLLALLYTIIFFALVFFLYSNRKSILNLINLRNLFLVSSVVLILFGYVFNKFNCDIINVPLFLSGIDDAHFLSVAKNAIDGNSFWVMKDLSAPFTTVRYNFPMLMAFYYEFFYFFGFFTDNVILVNNLYYICTYLFAVLGFILIARNLKINYCLALLGGLVFAFSQYHLFRSMHHVTASSYFVITLVFYFCLQIVFREKFNTYNLKSNDKLNLYSSLILSSFLIGSVDIFYAYFGCAFISLCLLTSLLSKRYVAFLRGAFFLIMIAIILFSNLYPSILNSIINGTTKTSFRDPYEAFYYGLMLVHLFMPKNFGEGHIFSWLTDSYNHTALFRSEATTSYLGIIGVCGFLILIFVLLVDSFRKILQKLESEDNKGVFKFLSSLNIFALLLGFQSGIGVIIALTGFTKVRTYNRISVYILMFCVLTSIYLFDILYKKFFKNPKQTVIVIFSLLLLFLHINETSLLKFPQKFLVNKEKIENIKEFSENINNHFKDGARILQLPILSYPENFVTHELRNCNYQIFPYLFTKGIQWSFGALSHTNEYFWQEALFNGNDALRIVENAKRQGFNGVSVNTDIVDSEKLLKDLKDILGEPLFFSKLKNIYFFDLKNFNPKEDFVNDNLNFIENDFFIAKGFSALERGEKLVSRWAIKTSDNISKHGSIDSYINYIAINNNPYKIYFDVHSVMDNKLKVYINDNLVGDFIVKKGTNIFETDTIYESSNHSTFNGVNSLRLEHEVSFRPSTFYENSKDNRDLTLAYREISIKN